jgi:hypothetical protein
MSFVSHFDWRGSNPSVVILLTVHNSLFDLDITDDDDSSWGSGV